MRRVVALVDGFNLYHSLAESAKAGHSTRWLDIPNLLRSYLYVIGGGAQLVQIKYFSALAHHRESNHPGTVARHSAYLDALRAAGVVVQLHKFSKIHKNCPHCLRRYSLRVEKETDVALGAALLESFAGNHAEVVLLVTGDTDLMPAIMTAKRLFAASVIAAAFPARRKNKLIESVVDIHFDLSLAQYEKYQFADPALGPQGKAVSKPPNW